MTPDGDPIRAESDSPVLMTVFSRDVGAVGYDDDAHHLGLLLIDRFLRTLFDIVESVNRSLDLTRALIRRYRRRNRIRHCRIAFLK